METREKHETQILQLKQQQDKVRKDMEDLQQFYATEMKNSNYRYQRLEEHLNDQSDIHHGELVTLKQEIGALAGKEDMQIVDFRSTERIRDLHELLEACNHKELPNRTSEEPLRPTASCALGVLTVTK